MGHRYYDEWYDDFLAHAEVTRTDDMKYGLPEQKKYPMPDRKHVLSAIKFFNYVSPKDEETLAHAILARMKEYGIDEVNVGPDNRFGKYYKPDTLTHHQIKGAKHGVRRWQNEDGSWTPAGRLRYGKGGAPRGSYKDDEKGRGRLSGQDYDGDNFRRVDISDPSKLSKEDKEFLREIGFFEENPHLLKDLNKSPVDDNFRRIDLSNPGKLSKEDKEFLRDINYHNKNKAWKDIDEWKSQRQQLREQKQFSKFVDKTVRQNRTDSKHDTEVKTVSKLMTDERVKNAVDPDLKYHVAKMLSNSENPWNPERSNEYSNLLKEKTAGLIGKDDKNLGVVGLAIERAAYQQLGLLAYSRAEGTVDFLKKRLARETADGIDDPDLKEEYQLAKREYKDAKQRYTENLKNIVESYEAESARKRNETITSKMGNAKKNGEYDIDFLETVQNDSVLKKGGADLRREYKKYLIDPEKYISSFEESSYQKRYKNKPEVREAMRIAKAEGWDALTDKQKELLNDID